MATGPSRPAGSPVWNAVRGRCPRCGGGRLFKGFLTVAETCEACGLGLTEHDLGDGPAVAVTFVLGFAVVGLAGVVELLFAPPLWVHAVLWVPAVIGGSIGLLRPLKAITLGLQYRFRSVDTPTRPGGQ